MLLEDKTKRSNDTTVNIPQLNTVVKTQFATLGQFSAGYYLSLPHIPTQSRRYCLAGRVDLGLSNEAALDASDRQLAVVAPAPAMKSDTALRARVRGSAPAQTRVGTADY